METENETLEECAKLVNAALVRGAEAGVAPKVLDSLLDSMRVISTARGEEGACAEPKGFE